MHVAAWDQGRGHAGRPMNLGGGGDLIGGGGGGLCSACQHKGLQVSTYKASETRRWDVSMQGGDGRAGGGGGGRGGGGGGYSYEAMSEDGK